MNRQQRKAKKRALAQEAAARLGGPCCRTCLHRLGDMCVLKSPRLLKNTGTHTCKLWRSE